MTGRKRWRQYRAEPDMLSNSRRSRELPCTEAIQRRARELRQRQTPAEEKPWARLRGKQLRGLKFRRQHLLDLLHR
jgi:very-short-patch-repair endonuclease